MARIRGGDKLKTTLAAIGKKLGKGGRVRVGFLENATYPDGTPTAMVAAIQEFGAPKVGIPPRPYFRNMIAAKSKEWPKAAAGLLKANDYDTTKTLADIGQAVQSQLQESILATNTPPLSLVTVMLRGMKSNDRNLVVTRKTVAQARARVAAGKTNYGASTKVLDDTGHLINSVDYEVKE